MKLPVIFSSFILTLSTHANAITTPSHCPSVSAIQSAKVGYVEEMSSNSWVAIQQSHFDTKENWQLTVFSIRTDDSDEAMDLANRSLSSLRFKNGPFIRRDGDAWICNYDSDSGYLISTTTGVKP